MRGAAVIIVIVVYGMFCLLVGTFLLAPILGGC